MRLHTCIVLLTWAMLTRPVAVAEKTSPNAAAATAVCSFSDGKQVSVQYTRELASSRGFPPMMCGRPAGHR
jgi:hypothetical protein